MVGVCVDVEGVERVRHSWSERSKRKRVRLWLATFVHCCWGAFCCQLLLPVLRCCWQSTCAPATTETHISAGACLPASPLITLTSRRSSSCTHSILLLRSAIFCCRQEQGCVAAG